MDTWTPMQTFKTAVMICVATVLAPLFVALADSSSVDGASHRVADYLTTDEALGLHAEDEISVANIDDLSIDATGTGTSSAVSQPETVVTNYSDGTEVEVVSGSGASDSSSTAANSAVAKPESDYIVKEGDTYGCIAEKYYGSFEHHVDVMAANGANLYAGFGEYRLDVGAKLVLPAVTAGELKPASNLCN